MSENPDWNLFVDDMGLDEDDQVEFCNWCDDNYVDWHNASYEELEDAHSNWCDDTGR